MNQKEYAVNRIMDNQTKSSNAAIIEQHHFQRFTDEQLLSANVFGLENPCWQIVVDSEEYYLSDYEYIKYLQGNLKASMNLIKNILDSEYI